MNIQKTFRENKATIAALRLELRVKHEETERVQRALFEMTEDRDLAQTHLTRTMERADELTRGAEALRAELESQVRYTCIILDERDAARRRVVVLEKDLIKVRNRNQILNADVKALLCDRGGLADHIAELSDGGAAENAYYEEGARPWVRGVDGPSAVDYGYDLGPPGDNPQGPY